MTPSPLRVGAATLEITDTSATLSGAVGEDRLFWRMPPRATIALRGEPFVAALLPSAMAEGRALVLSDNLPIDPLFRSHLDLLQEILARWWGLPVVEIHAPDESRPNCDGYFTGYSAGIDSSFTVMQLQEALDGVVLFDGIEYGTANPDLMRGVDETLRRVMTGRGLPLLTVQTNAKWIGKRFGGKWSQFIGGTLASVPHALGAARYAIAGSNAWENLRPYGTHPMTDPLWSSAATQVTHHGAGALRIEKADALRAAPDLLEVTRVCFQGTAYNCGICQKCLQTAAALRALGIRSPAIPPLEDPRALRALEVEHDGDLVDWAEIVPIARARQDKALVRELDRLLRRYYWRQAARQLDELATGGLLRRVLTRRIAP